MKDFKYDADAVSAQLGAAHVSMSVKEEMSFNLQQLGRFLVTAVYHHVDGVGHYHHTFEGIVADTERIPVRQYDKPLADIQLATVEDNEDPRGRAA